MWGTCVFFCQLLSILETSSSIGVIFLTDRPLHSLPLPASSSTAWFHTSSCWWHLSVVQLLVCFQWLRDLREEVAEIKRLEFESLLLTQLKPEEFDTEYDHKLCNMSSDSCMRPVTSGIQHLCLFRQTFSSISVPPGVGGVTVSLCTSVATLMAYFPVLEMVTLHLSEFAWLWLLAIRPCHAFSTRLMRPLVPEIFPL